MVVLSFSSYKKQLFSGNQILYGEIDMLVSAMLDVDAQPKIHALPPSLLLQWRPKTPYSSEFLIVPLLHLNSLPEPWMHIHKNGMDN